MECSDAILSFFLRTFGIIKCTILICEAALTYVDEWRGSGAIGPSKDTF